MVFAFKLRSMPDKSKKLKKKKPYKKIARKFIGRFLRFISVGLFRSALFRGFLKDLAGRTRKAGNPSHRSERYIGASSSPLLPLMHPPDARMPERSRCSGKLTSDRRLIEIFREVKTNVGVFGVG